MIRAVCLLSLGTRAYDGPAIHAIATWAERHQAHITFVELDTIERINSEVLGDMPRPNDFQQRLISINWPNGFNYTNFSELILEHDLVKRIEQLESYWHSDSHFDGLLRSQVYRSLHPRLRRIGVRNQRHPIIAVLAPYLIQELALLNYLRDILDIEQEISLHPHVAVRDYLAHLAPPWHLPRLVSLKEYMTVENAVTLDNVVVAIGDTRTVGPINMTLHPGEILGLLGINGSGKTTLLRGIGGHLPIRSGRLFVGDRQVDHLPAYDRGIATVFQDGGLFPDRSAEDNVLAGVEKARRAGDAQRALDIFTSFKAHFHSAHFWPQLPAQLSGGQKQLAAMARALAVSTEIILLDEPSASLDHIRKRLLIALLKGHIATHLCSAILISHDMEVLLALCDRFLVIGEQGHQIANISARDFVDKGRSMTAARILGLPNIFDVRAEPEGALTFVERGIEVTDPDLLQGNEIHGVYLSPEAIEQLDAGQTAPLGLELCGWIFDRIKIDDGELLFLRVGIRDELGETLMIRTRANLVDLSMSAYVRLSILSEHVRIMTQ